MSSLRDSLQAIYDQRGALTPRLVVDEARNEEHPLHSRFEWDDAVAGEKYRLDQAQRLIQVVKLSFTDGKGKEQSVRAYQSVRREDGHTYVPSEEVVADPFLLQLVLMDMKREWKSLQERYGHFSQFAQMIRTDMEEAS